jgi:predicted SnoaL-like aldol condensation-catalyzing enzyme
MIPLWKSAIVAIAFTATGGAGCAAAAERDLAAEESNRKLVVEFYDRFFNRHDVDAAQVVAEDYRQHNPHVPDGRQPFVSFFGKAFAENPRQRSRIVRSATDGDLVYLHVHATERPGDRGSAVVDIFRVKNGKIVEHWDVVQDVPEKAANDNTMF